MNNTFTIDGKNLMYKITWDISEYGESVKTDFFETYDTKKKKKYFFFGKEEDVIVPHTMFTIHRDFHSTKLPKEFWRREIKKKLKQFDSLKNRYQEIKNSEFV
jgi:hypothetical protein